ncbi:sugar transferase [Falsiroseomonas sp. E2-1-a20]|uniref:sugar transferase n=1 Tax=Falsiroseomonas sp. E2-1-a20 TaxID=3239300 RepID=UPI003F3A8DAA
MNIQPFQARRNSLGSRALDVVLAGLGILFLSPVLLLVTLAILIESGRPIFFAQTRLGQDGRHFRLFKFRKFKKCAVESGRPLTVRGDDRMSPIGRILEITKLDELPQLYNILKGEMSIVGPRPESLAFADCFDDANRAVLAYRPGIFGPSQVAFRDEGALYPPGAEPARLYRQVLFPTKAQLDLAYYPKRTLLSDIGWILCGVLAVVGLYRTRGGLSLPATGPSSAMGAAGSRGELGRAPSFTVRI